MQAVKYHIDWDICTQYAGADKMLLQRNGKLTTVKLKQTSATRKKKIKSTFWNTFFPLLSRDVVNAILSCQV